MINLRNISKSVRGRPVLSNVSFDVSVGDIFTLLGPAGSGKSTLLHILLGLVRADSGEARIRGVTVQSNRHGALERVGAVLESPQFHDSLTGWRNLELLINLNYHVKRLTLARIVERVGLTAHIHDRVGTYTIGMRQRLAFAQALIPEPELLLLDEPTAGADTAGIEDLGRLIKELAEEMQVAVLLTARHPGPLEELSTHVAILHQGSLIANGRWTPKAATSSAYRVEVEDWAAASTVLRANGFIVAGPGLFEPGTLDVALAVAVLVSAGLPVRSVGRDHPSLEEYYRNTTAVARPVAA